uniref:Uncharacterized protein n=1 Tax=Oxyrrhis marina TaxID=2969 RepID=A0A7S4GPJ1_OXYMA
MALWSPVAIPQASKAAQPLRTGTSTPTTGCSMVKLAPSTCASTPPSIAGPALSARSSPFGHSLVGWSAAPPSAWVSTNFCPPGRLEEPAVPVGRHLRQQPSRDPRVALGRELLSKAFDSNELFAPTKISSHDVSTFDHPRHLTRDLSAQAELRQRRSERGQSRWANVKAKVDCRRGRGESPGAADASARETSARRGGQLRTPRMTPRQKSRTAAPTTPGVVGGSPLADVLAVMEETMRRLHRGEFKGNQPATATPRPTTVVHTVPTRAASSERRPPNWSWSTGAVTRSASVNSRQVAALGQPTGPAFLTSSLSGTRMSSSVRSVSTPRSSVLRRLSSPPVQEAIQRLPPSPPRQALENGQMREAHDAGPLVAAPTSPPAVAPRELARPASSVLVGKRKQDIVASGVENGRQVPPLLVGTYPAADAGFIPPFPPPDPSIPNP